MKCKCVAPTLPPCDLLAKCDWHDDELRVELPQWPEVVSVWVNGKAMPYVPVVNDSKCDTCEAMLDCDECQRADASHKELRGLQAENEKLRELIRDMWRFTGTACKKYPRLFDQSAQGGQMVMPNMIDSFEQRMVELGVEADE